MPTDDKVVLGNADNFATRITFIIGSKPEPGGEYTEFRGFPSYTILHVTPDAVVSQRPNERTDGVTGVACLGGAGVRGIGAPVTIREGGRAGAGTGGVGVVGHGDSGDLESNDDPQFSIMKKTYDPGAGVVGIGGPWTGPQAAPRWVEGNRQGRDHRGGSGVIGVAGGQDGATPVPSFDQAKGVGVYGASAVGEGMVADGAINFAGLRATGSYGVWGISKTDNGVGVRGEGPTGMTAYGKDFGIIATGDVVAVEVEGGIGIRALGKSAPAGVFRRQKQEGFSQPQIHIEPLPMWVPDPEDGKTVSVLPPHGLGLPRWANAGDLLMTIGGPSMDRPVPPRPEATLWLCVVSASSKDSSLGVTAVWKQVLLGPPIEGTNDGKG
jgi:hypothetical protein